MNILGQNLLEFAHRGEGRRGGRDLQDSRLAYEDKALGCKVQGEVSLLEMTDNDRATQDLPMPVRMPKDDRVAVCQRPEGHAPFLHDSEVDQGVDQIGAPEVAAGDTVLHGCCRYPCAHAEIRYGSSHASKAIFV